MRCNRHSSDTVARYSLPRIPINCRTGSEKQVTPVAITYDSVSDSFGATLALVATVYGLGGNNGSHPKPEASSLLAFRCQNLSLGSACGEIVRDFCGSSVSRSRSEF